MELGDAYDNIGYISNAQTYTDHWSQMAAEFRATLKAQARAHLNLPYGASERQSYDLFLPDPSDTDGDARLCIFVHGGYWRRFDRSFWSHLAQGPLKRGWSVAMPSYDLCPTVTIPEITTQITQAIETIAATATGPIALVGHSAGGHLVSRMAEPGRLSPTTADRLHTITPISPVSDLRPLLKTSMNQDFQLTHAMATAESPVLMTDRLNIKTTVWVGADERPAFLDQARGQADAWSCPLRIAKNRHHFDVIDALQDPKSQMLKDCIR
jgi:acetyl esterase/lipase